MLPTVLGRLISRDQREPAGRPDRESGAHPTPERPVQVAHGIPEDILPLKVVAPPFRDPATLRCPPRLGMDSGGLIPPHPLDLGVELHPAGEDRIPPPPDLVTEFAADVGVAPE